LHNAGQRMTICSRFPTFSWPRFLTGSFSPLHDPPSLMLKPRPPFAAHLILSLGGLVVLVDLEVGGSSSSQNCTLAPTFLFLILPAGDESGCQYSQMRRMSNSRQIGSVKLFHRLPHVSIECAKCQSMRGRVSVTYG